MTVENNPTFSDLLPKNSIVFEGVDLTQEVDPQTQRELGAHALMIEDFFVLDTPEVGHKGLDRHMRSSVIGQDQAIDAIIEAMDRSSVRMPGDTRPVMTLTFLGPTGVGKTETARALAKYRNKDDPTLIKIDCSDFSSGHNISSLTGSPKGYIGYGEKPILNKESVERPGVVVLFDELEKGSDELYKQMLQILGDGKLTLKNGDEVDFSDAMIILTSNLGAKQMNDHLSKQVVGFGADKSDPTPEVLEKSALSAFKDFFKPMPEFLNRLDKMVVFNSLGHDSLEKILDNKFIEANDEYTAAYGMAVSATPAVYEYLIEKALEERNMGARPLVRAFEQDIQTIFGRHLSSNQIQQGSQIQVFHRSECSQEIQDRFPDSELIFTHRYESYLYEYHEEKMREIEAERIAADRARRKEEEEKKAAEAAKTAAEKAKKAPPVTFSDPDAPDDDPSDK